MGEGFLLWHQYFMVGREHERGEVNSTWYPYNMMRKCNSILLVSILRHCVEKILGKSSS